MWSERRGIKTPKGREWSFPHLLHYLLFSAYISSWQMKFHSSLRKPGLLSGSCNIGRRKRFFFPPVLTQRLEWCSKHSWISWATSQSPSCFQICVHTYYSLYPQLAEMLTSSLIQLYFFPYCKPAWLLKDSFCALLLWEKRADGEESLQKWPCKDLETWIHPSHIQTRPVRSYWWIPGQSQETLQPFRI